VTDSYTRNYAKNKAYELAGRMVWFREVDEGSKTMGRVVGYYYDMAQLLIECDVKPDLPVDPYLTPYHTVVSLSAGRHHYCLTPYHLVDVGKDPKNPRFPHDCPRCHRPALVFFRTVECSNISCIHYTVRP